ncbi:hypothetical protein [uncultured Endozoicomonas sp.]|uniref:hypothetical protein n=1 Tax=uncultured Endozoicomonas sp. TaxID=432652 RepID=UPI002636DEC3|nr:hypothetical protein [uncultured Endozoicomonas sp.]
MDQFEQASELEQYERQRILDQHRQRRQESPLFINGEPCCRDCEISIRNRIEAGINACRCIDCQLRHEKKGKHYA